MHYKINTKILLASLRFSNNKNSELIQFILDQIEYFEGAFFIYKLRILIFFFSVESQFTKECPVFFGSQKTF